MQTRDEQCKELFPTAPDFRRKQVMQAVFTDGLHGWSEVSALPKDMRATLEAHVPWTTLTVYKVFVSKKKDTHKAILKTQDDRMLESVLMRNARGHWTLCVSSQIGCAMNCSFCATGKMGLFRSLTSDEIIDQYRYWHAFLAAQDTIAGQLTNIVFMGMGEPMANYTHVKDAINAILAHTEIGPTRITVSSVGVVTQLEEMIDDPTWPPVRIAISLHSADAQTRKAIVPTSYRNFMEKIEAWAVRYLAVHGNRRRHITFEHIMIHGVNDTPAHARKLAALAHRIGSKSVRINLIPYNTTDGNDYAQSIHTRIEAFRDALVKASVTATIRRNMGDDIAAACGQLIVDDLAKNKPTA